MPSANQHCNSTALRTKQLRMEALLQGLRGAEEPGKQQAAASVAPADGPADGGGAGGGVGAGGDGAGGGAHRFDGIYSFRDGSAQVLAELQTNLVGGGCGVWVCMGGTAGLTSTLVILHWQHRVSARARGQEAGGQVATGHTYVKPAPCKAGDPSSQPATRSSAPVSSLTPHARTHVCAAARGARLEHVVLGDRAPAGGAPAGLHRAAFVALRAAPHPGGYPPPDAGSWHREPSESVAAVISK